MLAIHLQLMGWISLFLAVIYPVYPKYFGWREELQNVSLFTRQIFYVHCGFIVMLLALQGILLAGFEEALLEPNGAALALAAGLACFWIYRLVVQLFYYDRRLWLGHRFHTFVHVVFTLLWSYQSAVSLWSLRFQLGM